MKVKLTKRGKFVVWFLIISFGLFMCWWLNDMTTPPICKVPVSQMSQFCKDLLFPH